MIYQIYLTQLKILVMKKFLIILFGLSCFSGFTQITIESQILDSEGAPIPFAHVYHEQTRSGTISNLKGFFILNIPTDDQESLVKISSIGFQDNILTLKEVKRKNQIILKEWVGQLKTVTITPKNYELELFEKALDQIPNNYPDREMSEGFLKEQVHFEGRDDNPIYIAEATIESIKDSYEKRRSDNGDVKLLKGRKYRSPQMDSLNFSIYAGLFAPFRFDKVYTRSYMFSGKNLDKYDISISDTLSLDGVNLFVLEFKPLKKSLPNGTIYILDSTYAVVKTHFHFDQSAYKIDTTKTSSDIQRRFLTEETEYYRADDGLWRMKLSTYNTSFLQMDSILFLENKYVSTKTSEEFREISYLEKSQYGDYFLNNTGAYDPQFWDSHNVILPDSVSENLFKNYKEEDDEEIDKLAKQFERTRKISASFGIIHSIVEVEPHDILFSKDELTINNTSGASSLSSWSIFNIFKYEIKPKLYIGYEISWPLQKKRFRTLDVFIKKDFNLNPNGRPILIAPAVNAGRQTLGKYVGNFSSESSFELKNREFDSGETDVWILSKGYHIQPSISIEIEKSRTTHYFVRVGYNHFLERKTGLFLKETDQFFLKQKSRFIENNTYDLSITSTNDILFNRWNFSFGIVFGPDL